MELFKRVGSRRWCAFCGEKQVATHARPVRKDRDGVCNNCGAVWRVTRDGASWRPPEILRLEGEVYVRLRPRAAEPLTLDVRADRDRAGSTIDLEDVSGARPPKLVSLLFDQERVPDGASGEMVDGLAP